MAEPTSRAGRDAAVSQWSDVATGVTEEAAFVGPPGQQILAFLHRPTSEVARGGVLLCGSIFEDFQVNYRAELLTARALARRGYAAVRFHYRGVGNSDDSTDVGITFDSMMADALSAEAWLREHATVGPLTVCGSRVGALVAAELAAAGDHRALILWSPIIDGADFFRGMSRANRLAGVRAEAHSGQVGAGGSRSVGDGAVEMLGNVVHTASYEDLRSRRLPLAMSPGWRVLLLHLGLGDADHPQYTDLASRWTAGGALVEMLRVPKRQLWMVPETWEPEESNPTTQNLVEGILAWVDATSRES